MTTIPLDFPNRDETPALAFTRRPLSAEDAAWVRTFWMEHWGSDIMVVHGDTYSATGLPGFVAEQNGQVLGLATYRLEPLRAELMSLDSLIEGQGIGTALLEAVIAAARAAGCRKVILTTTNDNLNALRFYQKRGFHLCGLRPGAVEKSRQIKPSIPLVGDFGISIRDELELEKEI
jgi:ribosomal protein S18 acetylase RimI-like enzyme